MHVAGYHDGFTIPAGATSILITEEPVNPIVFLGECMLPRASSEYTKKLTKGEDPPYLQHHEFLSMYVYTVIRWVDSHVLSPDLAVAVITGAVPPLNGGLTIVASATFLAGGSVWTYTTGPANAERLESPGPLNTSVHIQVKDTVHERTYLRMCILN